MNDDALTAALLDLERQGWESLCRSAGADFYGRVMTADALMVLANGQVMDRDSVVRALAEAPPWRTFEISDTRVVHTGSDSAALVYVGTAFREDEAPAFVGAMASVYRRVGDEWRLTLYQQTPIPDSGG